MNRPTQADLQLKKQFPNERLLGMLKIGDVFKTKNVSQRYIVEGEEGSSMMLVQYAEDTSKKRVFPKKWNVILLKGV